MYHHAIRYSNPENTGVFLLDFTLSISLLTFENRQLQIQNPAKMDGMSKHHRSSFHNDAYGLYAGILSTETSL